ncbi:MAG: DNA-directed RNA polymerase subunit P [Nanoarchaeota archaeon]|nr:DNA-directed RNA polymerase subunit P [Nanoarchaeota archaeon]MBU4124521.1 DNA-directed RNA polymerase subunit P [Nanoarchaeota archaeon]
MYKCLNCGKEVSLEQANEKIRCPFCGYRIIMKTRPKKVVRVLAR